MNKKINNQTNKQSNKQVGWRVRLIVCLFVCCFGCWWRLCVACRVGAMWYATGRSDKVWYGCELTWLDLTWLFESVCGRQGMVLSCHQFVMCFLHVKTFFNPTQTYPKHNPHTTKQLHSTCVKYYKSSVPPSFAPMASRFLWGDLQSCNDTTSMHGCKCTHTIHPF